MIVPDVNVLLYAELTAYPEHARARAWWKKALEAEEVVGLTPPALFGFVRIATNPRVFAVAATVEGAVGRVEAWLARPNVRLLGPGPRHLEISFALLRALGAAGHLTTDVQLATYAIENAATLYSADTDFGRFTNLAWKNPLK